MSNSKFVTVKGSKIHYLEAGKGDSVLFLHGMSMSSHIWRNIIPKLAKDARCIAPDLIGCGKSDKPDIQYNLTEHIAFIEGFIEKLRLKKMTLVLHGFGSAIGFDYAMRHQKRVKAIAFYEAHVRPFTSWEQLSLPIQQLLHIMSEHDRDKIFGDRLFLEKLIRTMSLRKLGKEELDAYLSGYTHPNSRKSTWQYIKDFSSNVTSSGIMPCVMSYCEKLKKSTIPKLMLYSTPGFITTMETVQWCKDSYPNLQVVDLEDGLHFAQENNPDFFATMLSDWYAHL